MKTYRIILEKKAVKFLDSCTPKERAKLLLKIYELPFSTDVKKMEGYENRYRLRVGDYRIIFEKLDDILIILVLTIGNRGDIYK